MPADSLPQSPTYTVLNCVGWSDVYAIALLTLTTVGGNRHIYGKL